MNFRIAARTILHLGAELISSDGVALYELIKNSYDAKSPNAQIAVVMSLSRGVQRDVLAGIDAFREAERVPAGAGPQQTERHLIDRLKVLCLKGIIDSAPNAAQTRDAIAGAISLDTLKHVVQEANWISIADQGTGMSLVTLDEAFLTIGTRSKQRQKDDDTVAMGTTLLGEKGIGRLSAMRLGDHLRVLTATTEDEHWNELKIDWSDFDHSSDDVLEDIPIAPKVDGAKLPPGSSGTQITITALNREWSKAHIEEIARQDFARMNDPFLKTTRFPIILRHNDEPITIPRLEPWILNHAHGHCVADFRVPDDGPVSMSGRMEAQGKIDTFNDSELALISYTEVASPEILRALGGFSVEFYWFNRRLLTALDGIGDLATVRARLAQWTGGLMMFRDGFRVPPYGGQDDDWLDLDRIAFSRGGYKLNRAQIVGRVAITQKGNPKLKDQANREGLIDNEEKRAFRSLLAHLVQQTFWSFMVRAEKAAQSAREPSSQAIVEQRLASEEERLQHNLDLLIERVPAVKQESRTLADIRAGIANLASIMEQVRQLSRDYEEGRTQLLNLAGVGLTVEILAHELNRAAETALDTLAHLPTHELSSGTDRSLKSLNAQLKTLQKRLRVLDPLSTSGRNRKERLDIVQLVSDVLESHAEHFEREGVTLRFAVLPSSGSRLVVTVVRGMIVQVLENLISNSLYWLRQQRRVSPQTRSEITVAVDVDSREIRVADNGPGIAESEREKVFEAFYTKKPTGGGKGLGLFISREIAKYHGATLDLEPGDDDVYRVFVLNLGG
ncbi:ATP-binding protein (plasmid) [Devosia neptuniae]|uniref:histidine kinase n=1 Tax=Devosia neptuniae TaxID=191302 RepID=A0ABY6C721_9HYPH|nr:sensor histidine kinase [Devosia neptuniae]UXN67934.1 ATP-binding protein [Devosia neptuniae]